MLRISPVAILDPPWCEKLITSLFSLNISFIVISGDSATKWTVVKIAWFFFFFTDSLACFNFWFAPESEVCESILDAWHFFHTCHICCLMPFQKCVHSHSLLLQFRRKTITFSSMFVMDSTSWLHHPHLMGQSWAMCFSNATSKTRTPRTRVGKHCWRQLR